MDLDQLGPLQHVKSPLEQENADMRMLLSASINWIGAFLKTIDWTGACSCNNGLEL